MEAIDKIRKAEEAAEEAQKAAVVDAEKIIQHAKAERADIIEKARQRGKEYLKIRLADAEEQIKAMKQENSKKIERELKGIEEKMTADNSDVMSIILKKLSFE
ncbi:MAG: hypothetical protein Q4A86_05220 [Clostridia bacterium]|nr:hypothetical protein [Clostridia bacterium]